MTKNNIIHGMSQTPEYHSWESMKSRCGNSNSNKYKIYGGRGITICERWANSFENFLADMGRRPSDQHSVERKNNSLGYSPENCKWADRFEQANNKRNNVYLEYNGENLTKSQWARKRGMAPAVLSGRLRRGWPISRALNEPVQVYSRRA